ncbi:hypothetical protein BC332_24291 [Capsicum chinense]|nr:hypothetical protein BC332_24291 [Capsicum chinense]
MVGHENEFEMMQDQLARGSTELEVISIVGMGGIGKITLANKIYNDSFIMSHFDIRAKATVSQVYCAKNVVLSLLTSTSGKTDEFHERQDDRQLADRLQKCLKGRSPMVRLVLAWFLTCIAFPQLQALFAHAIDSLPTHPAWISSVGNLLPLLATHWMARFVVALSHLRTMLLMTFISSGNWFPPLRSLAIGKPPNQMRLLNLDESWKLLKRRVFVEHCIPPEFEQLGKQIAQKCVGLPLAIIVIAGLLSKIGEALDEWRSVSENVSWVVSTDPDVQCMRVLALSYHHLPHHRAFYILQSSLRTK